MKGSSKSEVVPKWFFITTTLGLAIAMMKNEMMTQEEYNTVEQAHNTNLEINRQMQEMMNNR